MLILISLNQRPHNIHQRVGWGEERTPTSHVGDYIGVPLLPQPTHLSEPAEPVTWPTTVWSNNQNLDVGTNLPVEDVVGEAWDTIAPNIGRELDPIALWSLTNLDHCCVKSSKIARTQTRLLRLVIGDVFKVLNSRLRVEEVTHLRSV